MPRRGIRGVQYGKGLRKASGRLAYSGLSLRLVETVSVPADQCSEAVEAVLLLGTYHEVPDPVALLEHLHPELRPSARLSIVESQWNRGTK